MELETILEIVKPRPSFWLRVWLFFFLLINRREGKRLIEALDAKMDELIGKADRMNRDLAAYAEDADKKLKESRERLAATGAG
jgi:low affinity Fe/Cu permease